MTDGDEVELLKQRLATVVYKIANLDETNWDLPNASCPDPIDFDSAIRRLYDERDRLKEMIANAEGCWELESQADT